ncbi:MAG: GHMP kinase [Chloroflexi bacterium]|nr:MAG: GHMP kinase [Chloroflexota bacterium]
MIISKTPLRLSLFGGGTDLPEFFAQSTGAVVSFAINKYIYVSVNEKFDGRTRVSYSKTEMVDNPKDLEHDLVRETLRYFGLRGLEITSISDIPGEGSGLGSSSAFTVSLVTALSAYMGENMDAHPSFFAEMAYEIERNLCGHPVGKQDHYAAAHGGLKYYQFNPDDTVNVEPIPLTDKLRTFLEQNVMLFWTGTTRSAKGILGEQALAMLETKPYDSALNLADAAILARRNLEDGDVSGLGNALDTAWYWKKKLATITTAEIDQIYDRAKLAGAQGGKICGAGGGGFLMLIAEPKDQLAVYEAVGLRRVFFNVEERGSYVVYKG